MRLGTLVHNTTLMSKPHLQVCKQQQALKMCNMAITKEWESRVARDTVGEKVIVCGRSVRWWDDEIKAKIEQRRQLYKRMVRGQEGLWDEYNKLRREVKHLVMEKKLNVWNGVVEKANADFEANKKEFWSFVGRRTKGRKGGVEALRNDSGVSVTSTKGKLKVYRVIISVSGRVVLMMLSMITGNRKWIVW